MHHPEGSAALGDVCGQGGRGPGALLQADPAYPQCLQGREWYDDIWQLRVDAIHKNILASKSLTRCRCNFSYTKHSIKEHFLFYDLV